MLSSWNIPDAVYNKNVHIHFYLPTKLKYIVTPCIYWSIDCLVWIQRLTQNYSWWIIFSNRIACPTLLPSLQVDTTLTDEQTVSWEHFNQINILTCAKCFPPPPLKLLLPMSPTNISPLFPLWKKRGEWRTIMFKIQIHFKQ